MPQGSLLPEQELHRLDISLQWDDRRSCTLVMLLARSKNGAVLASAGVHAFNGVSSELLPELARDAVRGWLYRGPEECTVLPAQAYRKRRKELS